MTQARSTQISLDATPYYHCINRCVRRAFLCGEDPMTGQNHEHRRQWILDKLSELDKMFTIDVCAYAIMSNHYHLVLHVNESQALGLSDKEVVERWQMLFRGHVLVSRWLREECTSDEEMKKARSIIETWRQRLMNISWFMRILNQQIARMANREDGVTGRFWEGRFKSQALLDEQALLACMTYVDLNPIRAGIAETPETSDYTSIQQRIREVTETVRSTKRRNPSRQSHPAKTNEKPEHKTAPALQPLMPDMQGSEGLPYRLEDYLQLVDWSARMVDPNKRGAMDEKAPEMIQRLGLDENRWQKALNGFHKGFSDFVGSADALERICATQGKRWIRGGRMCRSCFDGQEQKLAA